MVLYLLQAVGIAGLGAFVGASIRHVVREVRESVQN